MSRPAATSLGYWTPACTRDVDASSAIVRSASPSAGAKYASTSEAAPAAAACSAGYAGLDGTATSGAIELSCWLGRARPYTYFESHAATVASCIAIFRYAWMRGKLLEPNAPRKNISVAIAFQRYGGAPASQ